MLLLLLLLLMLLLEMIESVHCNKKKDFLLQGGEREKTFIGCFDHKSFQKRICFVSVMIKKSFFCKERKKKHFLTDCTERQLDCLDQTSCCNKKESPLNEQTFRCKCPLSASCISWSIFNHGHFKKCNTSPRWKNQAPCLLKSKYVD